MPTKGYQSGKKHESMGSEQPGGGSGGGPTTGTDANPATGDQHTSVSGESTESDPTPLEREQVAEDFTGAPPSGELEALAGFDPAHAINEGLPSQFNTEELEELQPAEVVVSETAESVCGRDDRVRISPATAIPWRWICQLIITMPNGAGFRGTGWFIGPKCVMTAGHCVYSKTNGGWARRIEVIPGMDGAARPFGSAVGTNFCSVAG